MFDGSLAADSVDPRRPGRQTLAEAASAWFLWGTAFVLGCQPLSGASSPPPPHTARVATPRAHPSPADLKGIQRRGTIGFLVDGFQAGSQWHEYPGPAPIDLTPFRGLAARLGVRADVLPLHQLEDPEAMLAAGYGDLLATRNVKEVTLPGLRGPRPHPQTTNKPDRRTELRLATTRATMSLNQPAALVWAVREQNQELLAAAEAFLIEYNMTGHTRARFVGDLPKIEQRGVIRVLTRNNPVTYFLSRGRAMGFDYELAAMAAESLGVRLEMVVPPRRDQLIPWLLDGRGDVIAASLSATEERDGRVAFSRPYLRVHEMLIERPGEQPALNSIEQLRGQRIHVRPSSSYYSTLLELLPYAGPFTIVDAPEDIETEELIAQVARGQIQMTVADSHILQVELAYGSNVVGHLNLSEALAQIAPSDPEKPIAFAVRPQNRQLKRFLDDFVTRSHRGLRYNLARKRYFENRRGIRATKKNRAGATGALSPYDALLKKYARRYGLDWRLVAAQAFQESRFDPRATSWMGAQGLFQVMPATGREMGFDDLYRPEVSAHAGIKYVHTLLERMNPELPFRQRIRFALAAYNAGWGHLRDARKIAREQGWDPDRWFGHVEQAMLLLEDRRFYKNSEFGYCRGSEPVRYVSEIQLRYDNYVKIFPR